MSAPAPRSRRTLFELAVGATAISFAAIFFRLALPTDPLLASALRLGLAALCLAAWRKLRPGPPPSARLARAGVIGGLLYALHFGTWVASLSLTSVAASVTLVTATPLLLAIVAFVLGKDRPTRVQVVAILVAVLGVVLIGGTDFGAGQLLGDALALAGAVAMAGYLWLARSLGDELDSIGLSLRAAAWGSLFLGLAHLSTRLVHPLEFPSASALGWIALAALLPQLIGHTLLTSALRRATPTEVGLATAAEPVLSTLLAWVWLNELPTPVVLLGCGVALIGVVVGVAGRRA